MSDKVSFNYDLSDRLSRSQFLVQLERSHITFSRHRDSGPASCIWQEGIDPIWTWEDRANNPLNNSTYPVHDILKNVGIYPPIIFQDLLVTLWKGWRSDEINDNTAKEELKKLFDWLESIGKSKPLSGFWTGKF